MMRSLALEGWAKVSQEFINKCVAMMPDRLCAVIQGGGAITGY